MVNKTDERNSKKTPAVGPHSGKIDVTNFFDLQALADTAAWIVYGRYKHRAVCGNTVFWVDALKDVTEVLNKLLSEFSELPSKEQLPSGESIVLLLESALFTICNEHRDIFTEMLEPTFPEDCPETPDMF